MTGSNSPGRHTRTVRGLAPTGRNAVTSVAATAVVGLLVAGCGNGGSSPSSVGAPSAGGSTSSPSAVNYSRCMHAHGVSQFPDPGHADIVPVIPTQPEQARQLGITLGRLVAAEHACQVLLPPPPTELNEHTFAQCTVDEDCPQALVQQALNSLRQFSVCMRSHGVADWPDPAIAAGGGTAVFDLRHTGIDPYSSRMQDLENQCEQEEDPVLGVPLGKSP
jgi:hypothetical protein